MTIYRGLIGMNRDPVETKPGVLTPVVEEVEFVGEVRNAGVNRPNAGMQEGLSASHVLSIITPEDSIVKFTEVAYVVWQSRKWSVTSIKYNYPRIELSLGGIYNG